MNKLVSFLKFSPLSKFSQQLIHHQSEIIPTFPKARYGGKQTVALLTGDGVGPELLKYTKEILQVANAPLEFQEVNINKDSDEATFEEALLTIKRTGVGIKGNLETREDQAISGSEPKNLRLRTTLNLFAYVQKCKSITEVETRHKNVDIVIIRENTEGEYSSLEHENVPGVVESLKIITATKSERIARYAFDFAVREGRKRVTAVHKANIMKLADGLFIESCAKVSKEYPSIKYDDMIVDNCSMQMVSRPQQFDVMVMPNLYGNVIGNIGAGIVGGAGVATGMNIGTSCAVFESGTRNSGRNLVGKNIANPSALILTSCDMLDYLGYHSHAELVRKAIYVVIGKKGIRTPDLGGKNTTTDIINGIIKDSISSGTLKYEVDIPLSCLAVNNDSTQVVVAGRNLIEVFSVDSKLKTICKIKSVNGNRSVKSGIQLYSNISDIAWSKANQSLLATASTNGSITIWNQSTRQLTEQVTLVAHSRSAHKVLFCDHEPNLVLSASQDSTVKFFDIRDYGSSTNPTVTMQLLSKGRMSPVRDVQVCPYSNNYLAVANENGDLQIWDVRNTKKCVTGITSHFCSIMSIDWYPTASPDGAGYLATAGCRDHLIKIWEVSASNRLDLICPIRTSNVNRISWRKEEYQIASSSNLNIDLSVHVWDIKRPYIPFASFEGHQDLITGIRWSNDRNTFFSVGKDGALIRHSFANAEYLIHSVNPIATDINPYGRLATAVRSNNSYGFNNPTSKRIHLTQPSINSIKSPAALMARQKFSLNKSFLLQFSKIDQQDGYDELFGMNTFINLAKNYKLTGESISKLCFYNSEIAKKEGDVFLSNLWLILNYMYGNDGTDGYTSEVNSPANFNKLNKDLISHTPNHRQDTDKALTSDGGGKQPVTDSDTTKDKSKHDISTGNSEENSDSQVEETASGLENCLTKIEGPMAFLFDNNQDYLFSDTLYNDSYYVDPTAGMFFIDSDAENMQRNPDLDISFSTNCTNDSMNTMSDIFQYDSISRNTSFGPGSRNDQDLSTTLQNKQFYSSNHDFSALDPNAIFLKNHGQNSSKSSSRRNSAALKNHISPLNMEICINNSTKLMTPSFHNHPRRVKSSAFEFFQDLVDQNCVQTVCTAVIVLAGKLNFSELTSRQASFVETWFQAYINLLIRYKLWSTATLIIKRCPLSSINSLNLQSTTITTKCARCNKILDKNGSLCSRHASDKHSINCSICHLTVRGEFVWCHGCGHGGHSQHIAEWYKTGQFCPSGCGHRCQFS